MHMSVARITRPCFEALISTVDDVGDVVWLRGFSNPGRWPWFTASFNSLRRDSCNKDKKRHMKISKVQFETYYPTTQPVNYPLSAQLCLHLHNTFVTLGSLADLEPQLFIGPLRTSVP